MKFTTRKSSGFTLIEVTITVLLSLLLTFGIFKLLITSNQSASSSDGLSQAQETGRFVMSFLASHIRRAGLDYVDNKGSDKVETLPFINCKTASLTNNKACSSQTSEGYSGSGTFNGGDRLAIAIVPSNPSTYRDCTGVGGYAEKDIVLNVFWVVPPTPTDPNSIGSLWCQGHTFNGTDITASNKAQSIANGIDAMHVLYGEAESTLGDNSLKNVTSYVNASNVSNWDRVYAVRLALLSRAITGSGNTRAMEYQLLDSAKYAINDNVTRQVFSSTYVIRNYN